MTTHLCEPRVKDDRRRPPKPAEAAPELGFRWVLPATDSEAGYLVITKGHAEVTYRVRLLERDAGMGELWRLRRMDERADGTEVAGEVYSATLGYGHDSCTCLGFRYSRKDPASCRHCSQLRAALEWLDNGGRDRFAAVAPPGFGDRGGGA
jgi:hypothetical protein